MDAHLTDTLACCYGERYECKMVGLIGHAAKNSVGEVTTIEPWRTVPEVAIQAGGL